MAPESVGDENWPKFFKANFIPLKLKFLLLFCIVMGRIKCSLCFIKKRAKKSVFDPKIDLRTQRFDTARNSYFTAHFSNARFKCSRPLRNCGNIKLLYGRGWGERRLDIAQTIGLNCSMTHIPGKIQYSWHFFLMTFRMQKNSVKMVFVLYRVLCLTAH
jgi:hypothetical protein